MGRTLIILIALCSMAESADRAAAPGAAAVPVTVYGKLRSKEVVRIGGETTGTTVIFSGGVTWELKLTDNATKRFAEENHKKLVAVTGQLRRVAGVEVGTRWIIDVEQLTAAKDNDPKDTATFTLRGKLRPTAKGPPSVIEIGEDAWPVEWKNDPALHQQAIDSAGLTVQAHGHVERDPDFTAKIPAIFRIEKLQAPAIANKR